MVVAPCRGANKQNLSISTQTSPGRPKMVSLDRKQKELRKFEVTLSLNRIENYRYFIGQLMGYIVASHFDQ